MVTGAIYNWNGKPFGAGFLNGYVFCPGTELGAAIVALAGPTGIYAGTIIGNAVGSATQTLMKYDKKFGEVLKVFFGQIATILSSQ